MGIGGSKLLLRPRSFGIWGLLTENKAHRFPCFKDPQSGVQRCLVFILQSYSDSIGPKTRFFLLVRRCKFPLVQKTQDARCYLQNKRPQGTSCVPATSAEFSRVWRCCSSSRDQYHVMLSAARVRGRVETLFRAEVSPALLGDIISCLNREYKQVSPVSAVESTPPPFFPSSDVEFVKGNQKPVPD